MMPDPIILVLFILATVAMVYEALKKYCHLHKSERNLKASNTDRKAAKSSIERISPIIRSSQTPLSSSRSEDIERQEKEEINSGKSYQTSFTQRINDIEPDMSQFKSDKSGMPLKPQKITAYKNFRE